MQRNELIFSHNSYSTDVTCFIVLSLQRLTGILAARSLMYQIIILDL